MILARHLSIRHCSNLSFSRSDHQKGEHAVFTGVLFLSVHLRRIPVHKYMQHDGPHANAWNINETCLDSDRKPAPFFGCLWAEFKISHHLSVALRWKLQITVSSGAATNSPQDRPSVFSRDKNTAQWADLFYLCLNVYFLKPLESREVFFFFFAFLEYSPLNLVLIALPCFALQNHRGGHTAPA